MSWTTFFGFNQDPFARDLPPEKRFVTSDLDELQARLQYLVETRGIGLLLGAPGSGKSTALRRLRDSLHPEQVRPIYLHDTAVNIADLYRQLALELGIEPCWRRAMTFRAIRAEIDRLLTERKIAVLLIIDEAHRLHSEVLAELPVLTNFGWDGDARLPILLAGQPGLANRLRMASLEALAQRVTVRYQLHGYDRTTTSAYLDHRLTVAGVGRPLFTEPAVEALFNATQGVMRRIDSVARHALVAAAAQRAKLVDIEHVRAAADEVRT